MIDEVLFGSVKAALRPEAWQGNAAELLRVLTGKDSDCAREADKLLVGGRAVCGKYLARLAKEYPERFCQHKENGLTVWTIQPPVAASASASATDFRDKLEAHIRVESEERRNPAAAPVNYDGCCSDGFAESEQTHLPDAVPLSAAP